MDTWVSGIDHQDPDRCLLFAARLHLIDIPGRILRPCTGIGAVLSGAIEHQIPLPGGTGMVIVEECELSAEIGRPVLTAEQPVQAVREGDIVSRLGNAISPGRSISGILHQSLIACAALNTQ